jgi:tetratricopeptide (TPR) repeat protein
MKRLPLAAALFTALFLLVAADGCSSDPNVEGAKLDLRNKQYDRAIENLNIALEKNPDNAEAHQLKGEVLAAQAFETPDVDEHIQLVEQAIVSYRRAAEIDPMLSEDVTMALRLAYQSEFQRGVQAFNRGRNQESEYNSSAAYFDMAAQIQPDSAGAYVNEAYALMNAGRTAEAMEPFEMAIEKGDTELDSYRFLASIYLNSDRPGDAVAILEEASGMYPDDEDVQAELLNAYQVAGQTDRALEMYEQAIQRNPDNKLYRYNYGSLLSLQERYDDAIVQLERAIEIDPQYANAHYNLGAAYVNQAVVLNEEIIEKDDQLRANQANLTAQQRQQADAEITALAGQRTELFRMAIAPLERALEIFRTEEEDATDVCRALFQSYVQTDQTEKAETVAACAGFEDTSTGN